MAASLGGAARDAQCPRRPSSSSSRHPTQRRFSCSRPPCRPASAPAGEGAADEAIGEAAPHGNRRPGGASAASISCIARRVAASARTSRSSARRRWKARSKPRPTTRSSAEGRRTLTSLTRRGKRQVRYLSTMRGCGTTGWGRSSRRSALRRWSAVKGADDAERAAVDDVSGDHRGPRELLLVPPRHGVELGVDANRRHDVLEQGERLLPREDREDVLRPARAFERFEPGCLQIENPLVEAEERAQRSVLRGCRGVECDCKLVD
jgi:hypothetical protein